MTDSRRGKNTQFPLADLLRQSVYSRIAGYEDVNGAEWLSQDPTFRLIGSGEIWERGAAPTPRLQFFQTEVLAQEENFAGSAAINRELIGKAENAGSPQRVELDMDSTGIPVYGRQENSAHSGLFESTCCHPPPLFNREGDCLAARLRLGKVRSAEDWEKLRVPEIARQQKLGQDVVFRARPGWRPGLRQAGDLRSPGGAGREVRHSHSGQREPGAGNRRTVAWSGGMPEPQAAGLVQELSAPGSQLENGAAGGGKSGVPLRGLFPRVGFIATNLETDSQAVVRFYNRRGAAERWIKAGKHAVKTMRLSCRRFRPN